MSAKTLTVKSLDYFLKFSLTLIILSLIVPVFTIGPILIFHPVWMDIVDKSLTSWGMNEEDLAIRFYGFLVLSTLSLMLTGTLRDILTGEGCEE